MSNDYRKGIKKYQMCVLKTSFETKDQRKNYKTFRLYNKIRVF